PISCPRGISVAASNCDAPKLQEDARLVAWNSCSGHTGMIDSCLRRGEAHSTCVLRLRDHGVSRPLVIGVHGVRGSRSATGSSLPSPPWVRVTPTTGRHLPPTLVD